MKLDVGAASMVGRVRSSNQDDYLVSPTLVAVADGMGGHAGGEVASNRAIRTVSAAPAGSTPEQIVGLVHRANREIFSESVGRAELRGMGTTLCLAAVVEAGEDDLLLVTNVGDSRAYYFGPEGLVQLTEDHSLVESMVRQGTLAPEAARTHPDRNVLIQVLGDLNDPQPDSWLLRAADGDRFLLCSDGLHSELDDAAIAAGLAELRHAPPPIAALHLAELADRAGGHDNITVVVADAVGTGRPPSPLGSRLRRCTVAAVGWDNGTPTSPARIDRVTAQVPALPAESVPTAATDESLRSIVNSGRPRRRTSSRTTALLLLAAVLFATVAGLVFLQVRGDGQENGPTSAVPQQRPNVPSGAGDTSTVNPVTVDDQPQTSVRADSSPAPSGPTGAP